MDKFISKSKTRSESTSTQSSLPSTSGLCHHAENISSVTNLDKDSFVEKAGNKRRKLSRVWNFFKKSSDKKLAKCLTCGKEYRTSGNTSNLSDHIKRFHPKLLSPEHEEDEESEASASTSSSARSSVRSISPFFRRKVEYDAGSQRKKQLDQALTLMIATDYQPFNIVNDSGFRSFVNLLDPKYVLPSKSTIREKLMKEMYRDAYRSLQDILNEINYVAITTDSWTSMATESYLTVTCHFVTNDYKLQSAVLSTKPLLSGIHHTSDNIASTLYEIFTEWNIEKKISCIVTDNAANMVKTCELLKKKYLPCFAHTLNLVVQSAISEDCVKTIFIRCKEIVTFLKSSNIATEIFKKEQNTDQPYKLVQEVSTRWNSAFQMIKRILETSEALNRTLLKVSKAPPPLKVDEIIILKEFESIMSSLNKATELISGANYVTISLIIPITQGIYTTLTSKMEELETNEGKQLCSKLLEAVKARLFPYEQRTVSQVGTLLDPRFKQEAFRSSDNAKYAAQFLEKEMCAILNQNAEQKRMEEALNKKEPASSTVVSQTASSSVSLFSFMEEKVQMKVKSSTADAIIIKKQYLERQNLSQDTDPLLFWKVNGQEFDPMHQCSKKYVCIPASSVESERIFSTTGQIVTERRSRLKSKNVDILTFIKKNNWLISSP